MYINNMLWDGANKEYRKNSYKVEYTRGRIYKNNIDRQAWISYNKFKETGENK